MEIDNDFTFDEILYLKHDIDQKPRMVLNIIIGKQGVMYEVISGMEVSIHFGSELSKEKTVF